MCKNYENTYHPNCHKLIAERYRYMILDLSTLLKHVHPFVYSDKDLIYLHILTRAFTFSAKSINSSSVSVQFFSGNT